MKILRNVIAGLIILNAAGAVFAGDKITESEGAPSVKHFEGIVEVYGTGDNITNSAKIVIKGRKAKIFPKEQIGTTNGYPILNYETGKLYILSLKEKYYMEMSVEPLEKNLSENTVGIVKTGKKDTLLSYPAEEWSGTDQETGTVIKLWGSPDLKAGLNFLVGLSRQGNGGLFVAGAAKELIANDYFPLKITATDKSGAVLFYWEVKSILLQNIDDSNFEIPAGYQRLSEYLKKTAKTTKER